MFLAQWVSRPYVLKALIYKGFQLPQSFTLVINTTVSTWLDRMFLITTTAHFQPIGSVDTIHTFCLYGRCSQPDNARLVERSTTTVSDLKLINRFLRLYQSSYISHLYTD